MTSSLTTKHLRITGRVQGVSYRAGFAGEARRLPLSGWVRNRLDGSVEAMVQGTSENVTTIIAWARRGPPMARVDDVIVNDLPCDALRQEGLTVLPTE
jgi:acylphosphatase